MASSTYKDIIDDKVASWQNGLKKLEEQATKSSSPSIRAEKLEDLRARIESAVTQLNTLDQQENVGNTMETKDKILKIFSSIDKNFPRYEEQAPYML